MQAFDAAIACLQQLNRVDEIDEFREKASKPTRTIGGCLAAVAQSYLNVEHYGFMIAGEFRRGQHRGGGKVVHATARDRVRALQLYRAAMKLAAIGRRQARAGRDAAAVRRGAAVRQRQPWRLQSLTDLDKLPDYEEGWGYGGEPQGAPVDDDGNPIFYALPKSWDAAKNDGERWRWLLETMVEWQPVAPQRRAHDPRPVPASAVRRADDGPVRLLLPQPAEDSTDKTEDKTGIWALDTLGEDETIARLATGIKRFKLPDEHNFIKLYQQVVDDCSRTTERLLALERAPQPGRDLSRIAASIRARPNTGDRRSSAPTATMRTQYQQRLDQIVGNWGQFEGVMTQPAGRGATVDFRFRNGKQVEFDAHEINVRKLLDDVKAYLKCKPKQLDWQQMNIADIGYRLVQENQKQVRRRAKSRSWKLDLEPRDKHFDKRITVTTPLQKAGAYLVTANVADGNTSQDRPLARRHGDRPQADAGQVVLLRRRRRHRRADRQGQRRVLRLPAATHRRQQLSDRHQGLRRTHRRQRPGVAADSRRRQRRRRTANFSGSSPPRRKTAASPTSASTTSGAPSTTTPSTTKSKRSRSPTGPSIAPARRWSSSSGFARPSTMPKTSRRSPTSRSPSRSTIPRAKRSSAKRSRPTTTAASPASSSCRPTPRSASTSSSSSTAAAAAFRVEEYKKPEFEVTVDAPTEPVMLGEKITATIRAKYYFGSPVDQRQGEVQSAAHRAHGPLVSARPVGLVVRPGLLVVRLRLRLVSRLARLGLPAAGAVVVLAPADAAGNRRRARSRRSAPTARSRSRSTRRSPRSCTPTRTISYTIQAEVVDQSRRTIVGTGDVLVARKPFQVFAWVDRGYYRVGDTIKANFAARTLDGKPVEGTGKLRLLKITYGRRRSASRSKPKSAPGTSTPTPKAAPKSSSRRPKRASIACRIASPTRPATKSKAATCSRSSAKASTAASSASTTSSSCPTSASTRRARRSSCRSTPTASARTVLLFVRPANGVYLPPQMLRLDGQEHASTKSASRRRTCRTSSSKRSPSPTARCTPRSARFIVPPEKRVLNVEVAAVGRKYKPGEQAKVKVKLTDAAGKPFVGSTVLSIYDKSVEYISGGSNVPTSRSSSGSGGASIARTWKRTSTAGSPT